MLSDIQLPDSVIGELYKLPLIPGEKGSKITAVPEGNDQHAVYKFLGKNQRHIIMIVDFRKDVFLPEEHLQFISKILEACKMNLADVAIINTNSAPVNIESLRQQLAPAFIILFGIEPVKIGLPLSLDGAEGSAALEALATAAKFRRSLHLPVYVQDERLTTLTATAQLKEAGRNAREVKELVDSESAAVILGDFIAINGQAPQIASAIED